MGRPKQFTDTQKWCPTCKTWKLHSEFSIDSGTPSKLDNYCKSCKSTYYNRNSGTYESQKYSRDRHRKYFYGLTPERYKEMFEEQNGMCALPSCGRNIEVIDHDHDSGTLRRLLCKQCNFALGNFRDNPELMRDAANYIESFKEN